MTDQQNDSGDEQISDQKKSVTFFDEHLDIKDMQEQTEEQVMQMASNSLVKHSARHEDDVKGEVQGPRAMDKEDGESSEYEMVEESGEEEMEDPAAAQSDNGEQKIVGEDGQAVVEQPPQSDKAALDKDQVDDKPPVKGKKKKMVRRKKVKKPDGDAGEKAVSEVVEDEKTRDRAIQMPEWTQALEIEYMNQDQLKRVIDKLREENLSDDDIKLGEDLFYKRAAFKMDKFVKLCEVREIVQSALHSILDRMRKADEIARKNRTEITVLDSKFKSHQASINHLKRLENGQSSLVKMQKEQEIKLSEVNSQISDWKYEAQVKHEERQTIDEDILREIHILKNQVEHLTSQKDFILESQQKDRAHIHNFTENTQTQIDEKILILQSKVDAIPQYFKEQVMLIQTMKEQITIKQTQQFETVVDNLKVDNNRIIEMDSKIQSLKETKKKLDMVSNEVIKLRSLEDGIFQAHCFIERSLPMLIHHQVCEGLSQVVERRLPDLMEWEKKKTNEVYEHTKLCEGLKPDVSRFRKCVEKFTENAWKYQIGSAPFTYGEGKDYWAEITPKNFQNYDKRKYHVARQVHREGKIQDQDALTEVRAQEHLNHLLMAERESTKAFIQQTVTAMTQQSSRSHNRSPNNKRQAQQMQSQSKQQPLSPNTRQPTAGSAGLKKQNTGKGKRVGINSGGPSRDVNTGQLIDTNQSVQQSAAMTPSKRSSQGGITVAPLDQPSNHSNKYNNQQQIIQATGSSGFGDIANSESNHNILLESEDDQMLHSAQNSNDSQYNLHGSSQKVIKTTQVINKVAMVMKMDKVQHNRIRNDMKYFMSCGRTQFNKQLEKWQEFHEETYEDFYEMQSRMDKLETFVEILTANVEDMEYRGSHGQPTKEVTASQQSMNKDSEDDGSQEEAEQPTSPALPAQGRDRRQTFVKRLVSGDDAANNMNFHNRQRSMTMAAPKTVKHQSTVDELKKGSNLMAIQESNAEQEQNQKSGEIEEDEKKTDQKSRQTVHFSDHDDMFGKNLIKKVIRTNTILKPSGMDSTFKDLVNKSRKSVKIVTDQVDSSDQSSVLGGGILLSPDRKSRLNKLEDTQKMLNSKDQQQQAAAKDQAHEDKNTKPVPVQQQELTLAQKAQARRDSKGHSLFVGFQKPQTIKGSSQSEDSMSSLGTIEKNQNQDAIQKQSGNSFHFAKEFLRNTFSRRGMTEYVQNIFEKLSYKTTEFQTIANVRYSEIVKEKQIINDQNQKWQDEIERKHIEFTKNMTQDMKLKGLQMQELLLSRININESHVTDFELRLKDNEREIQLMTDRMRQEYQDFANNRKRWKSDFSLATDKAVQNMENIKEMLSGCESQNIINTQAIKKIIDAQMIEQLVQRQDIEDRKRLLVLATKKDKDLLSTDLGVTGNQVFGPNVKPENLKFDRNKKAAKSKSPSKGARQPNQNGKQIEVPRVPTVYQNDANLQVANQKEAVKDFQENAARITPPILKVDRACMSCAENKAMTLNAIKVACLTHTQSAIPYQGKNYHVSDLLDVKAQVVAQCQRMIRENLFKTKANAGIDIRAEDNEKGFVIEPLGKAKPIRVSANLEEIVKRQQYTERDKGSIMFNQELTNSPTANGRYGDISQQEDSIVQRKENMFARYPHSPHNLIPAQSTNEVLSGDDELVLELAGQQIINEHNYKSNSNNMNEIHSINQQNVVNSANDDLFSSNANLTAQSISVAQKIQRGASQMSSNAPKENSAAMFGRANFAHIRFSSSSRINHTGKKGSGAEESAVGAVRRSLFEQSHIQEGPRKDNGGALPDVQPQRGAYPQKFGNLDFEHMFESSQFQSTKHSQVRQSSILTGTTNNQQMLFAPNTGIASTRNSYRIGQQATEDNYRASDGFKNMQVKKLANKKHSDLPDGNSGSRPHTQQNMFGTKRVQSFQSGLQQQRK